MAEADDRNIKTQQCKELLVLLMGRIGLEFPQLSTNPLCILLLTNRRGKKKACKQSFVRNLTQESQRNLPLLLHTKCNTSAYLQTNKTISRCSEINSTFLSKWLAVQRVPCTSCSRGRFCIPGKTTQEPAEAACGSFAVCRIQSRL